MALGGLVAPLDTPVAHPYCPLPLKLRIDKSPQSPQSPSAPPDQTGLRPPDAGVLDNGLRVLTLPLPHLHSGLAAIFVRAGSRHETAANNGVSHFLEHLLFRGSERFPQGRAMTALVEDAGGDLNGVTSRDHGLYTSPVHPARLDVPLEVLGELVSRPLLKEVEVEREVVLEEILDEVDEAGRDIDADNLIRRALFRDHPLGFKIAGTREGVAALSEEAIRAHHARAYVARNMLLVCAGPFEHAQVMSLAERSLGQLRPGERLDDGPPPEQAARGPELILVEHAESQVQLELAFRAPPERHPDAAPLSIVRRLLADGLASRLQIELVERRGLAYSTGASIDAYADAGVFELGAACAPKKAPAVAEVLLRLLGELCETLPSEEELVRTQRKARLRVEFMRDSPGELVEWWGLGELLFWPPESVRDWLGRLEAVTPEDVRRVSRAVFRREALIACAVGPLGATGQRLRDLLERAEALPQ
jgi:predicted Zn-dependent peptidase